MKVQITYEKPRIDTVNGYILTVTQTFTTSDKDEMDKWVEYLDKNVGSGIRSEDKE